MTEKKSSSSQELLKMVLNQISGDIGPGVDLLPEYVIVGKGDIMCYDPSVRMFKKVPRGTKTYIIIENYDYNGRALVYTITGELLCIDPDELFLLVGFD